MPPIAQPVTFPGSTQTTLNGFLVRPDDPELHAALVIIHEAFGLNDDMRDIARRFAGQGYVALAVDLFSGRNQVVCMFRMLRGLLFGALDHGGIRDLKAALTYLAAQPGVDSERLGAVGYCLGGSLAIAWACTDDRLRAIAPFYGMNPRPLDAVARACPVVGSYPEKDFTARAGRALDRALDQYSVPHAITIYPEARHSFFNQGRHFHAAAARASWDHVLAFFKEHIG